VNPISAQTPAKKRMPLLNAKIRYLRCVGLRAGVALPHPEIKKEIGYPLLKT